MVAAPESDQGENCLLFELQLKQSFAMTRSKCGLLSGATELVHNEHGIMVLSLSYSRERDVREEV